MTEFWLTGPVDGVHPLLMPAAHAFLQVRQEIPQFLDGLSTRSDLGAAGAVGLDRLSTPSISPAPPIG